MYRKVAYVENPQNFDDELSEMKNSEREGEMEMDPSKSVVNYRDKPPHDDCCPICFDDFHFPCRTSCGHWFCSSCILMFWRYSANFKACKCPICGRLIANLAAESSMLIQQEEEAAKILKNIELYNHLNNGGWYALFVKAVAQPLLIRRRLREYPDPIMLNCIFKSLHLIGLLLGVLYKFSGFEFCPLGAPGIALFFDLTGHVVVLFLVLDVLCQTWITRRRVRHLPGLQ